MSRLSNCSGTNRTAVIWAPRFLRFGRVAVFLGLIGPAVIATGAASPGPHHQRFDVVVYGATASGVMAASAAGQMGMRVALVDPGMHVGGMISGGLSYSDVTRQEGLIGGLTLEFFKNVRAHYGQTSGWSFEPHIAEMILRNMLARAHVEFFPGEPIQSLMRNGARIDTLQTTDESFTATVFIDSSYEGDLMKMAGVDYTVGREGRDRYHESLAGRMDLLPAVHQFATRVSAEGLPLASEDPASPIPHITPQSQLARTGDSDGRFQSYCYRLILTDKPDNRIEITKPEQYNPRNYELLKRYIQSNPSLTLKGVLGINRIPNGKADANSNGPVSLDFPGGNSQYPDGSPQLRRKISAAHLSWAKGLVYFLQNDPSVPAALQSEARQWGLPKDEFIDTGHWPNQLYVREGRRMLGEYVLTQADLQTDRLKPDVVGMAGYNIDIREVQWLSHAVYRFPTVDNEMFTEGYMSQPVEPWEIPYRALLPKKSQASNLIVTVCISASTIAYASFRVEPTYMIAGESAGVAAALAAESHMDVQSVDIVQLQAQLRRRGQILSAQAGAAR